MVWDRDREKQRIQQDLDALLDKAGESGIGSLTPEEHERFRDLSRKLEEIENRG
ncbi:MAG: hypothetical protein OHK006_18960 [Thermodesulfovibrionales bacterium]